MRESFASALEWWRDAGVDTLTEDAPRDWLARPQAAPARLAESERPAEVLPDTLEAFLAWRTGEAAPERGWMSGIVPPAGPAGGLMIVLDMPEAEDEASGVLASGPGGRLLDRMLAAIGTRREAVHLAALAVARPLTGQVPPEDAERLAYLLRHHITLAAPERLLILGDAVKRLLNATNGAIGAPDVSQFNAPRGTVATVASFSPQFLLQKPAAKAEAWRHLLALGRGDM